MIIELMIEGGWRSVVVAVLALLALAAWQVPGFRPRAPWLSAFAACLGPVFSMELSAQRVASVAHAESPVPIALLIVDAFVFSMGPTLVALLGMAVIFFLNALRTPSVATQQQQQQEVSHDL